METMKNQTHRAPRVHHRRGRAAGVGAEHILWKVPETSGP